MPAVASWAVILSLGLSSLWAATVIASGTTCRPLAAHLREHLEGVTEAVIDGRARALPLAADQASKWWRTHSTGFGSRLQADSSLAELVRAAHGGNGKQAARLAVQLSAQSFEWCGGVTGTNDRLMVLDLAGMTGWLRSRGVHLAWPGDVHVAARGVSNALVRRHHPELASRLERSVAALVSTTESPQGDIRPATRLLDLVDEIEKVVR